MTQPLPSTEPLSYQRSADILPFSNRSGQLIAVGILLILSAVVTGCFTAMTPLAAVTPPQPGQHNPTIGELVIAGLTYAALTTILAWLGIGALMRRRWARPLTIIIATHWLLLGIATMLFAALFYPVLRDLLLQTPGIPPQMPIIVLVIMLVGSFVSLVLLPGIVLLLLHSPDVRLTLEHFDPTVRWTDRCPVRILGLSLTLYVLGLLFISGAAYGLLPFFGLMLTGVPAMLGSLLIGGLLLLAGWLVYRMRRSGWWMGLVVVVAFFLGVVPTSATTPMEQYYQLIKLPETQIDAFMTHESLMRGMAIGFSVLFAVSWAIYMIRLLPQMNAPATYDQHSA